MDENGECRECPDGTECDAVGNELGSLMVEAGYFRPSPISKSIYKCPLGETSCPGGNATGDALCDASHGYTGPLVS